MTEPELAVIRRAYAKQVLAAAFERGGGEKVTRLLRRAALPGEPCWVSGEGWCLLSEQAA